MLLGLSSGYNKALAKSYKSIIEMDKKQIFSIISMGWCSIIIFIFKFNFLFAKIVWLPEWANAYSLFEIYSLLTLGLVPVLFFTDTAKALIRILSLILLIAPVPTIMDYLIQMQLLSGGESIPSIIYMALLNTVFQYVFVILSALLIPIGIVFGLFMVKKGIYLLLYKNKFLE